MEEKEESVGRRKTAGEGGGVGDGEGSGKAWTLGVANSGRVSSPWAATSLLATHYALRTTHYSLLTTPLTAHYSVVSSQYSLLTTYY